MTKKSVWGPTFAYTIDRVFCIGYLNMCMYDCFSPIKGFSVLQFIRADALRYKVVLIDAADDPPELHAPKFVFSPEEHQRGLQCGALLYAQRNAATAEVVQVCKHPLRIHDSCPSGSVVVTETSHAF